MSKVIVPMTKIRKAVFPVAGVGARFLPATKAMPKEISELICQKFILSS